VHGPTMTGHQACQLAKFIVDLCLTREAANVTATGRHISRTRGFAPRPVQGLIALRALCPLPPSLLNSEHFTVRYEPAVRAVSLHSAVHHQLTVTRLIPVELSHSRCADNRTWSQRLCDNSTGVADTPAATVSLVMAALWNRAGHYGHYIFAR